MLEKRAHTITHVGITMFLGLHKDILVCKAVTGGGSSSAANGSVQEGADRSFRTTTTSATNWVSDATDAFHEKPLLRPPTTFAQSSHRRCPRKPPCFARAKKIAQGLKIRCASYALCSGGVCRFLLMEVSLGMFQQLLRAHGSEAQHFTLPRDDS